MEVTSRIPLIALHGFLGLSEDWRPVLEPFSSDYKVDARDLWQEAHELQSPHFQSWSDAFLSKVEEQNQKPVLMGYSMGARLALHALLRRPDLFRAAILVSVHPGLRDPNEKATRWAQDQKWAERWVREEWSSVLRAWNSQPVLRSYPDLSGQDPSVDLLREEASFDRQALARGMRGWSLAHQEDLREALAKLEFPLLFLVGSEDEKFRALLESLDLGPRSQKKIIQGAGHRVPWDRPKSLVAAVSEFLASLPE